MIYPPATQRPGPAVKQGYQGIYANAGHGVVCHSMVGYFGGAMIELDKLSRRASWHFSVLQDGSVYQHYDTGAVTWHCGSRAWNAKLIGIEHEGGANPYDEPLTDIQRDASVALVRWLAYQYGFSMSRKVSLWEHNEVAPPEDATACPSHRIPWGYYTEEDDMTERVWDGSRTWIVGKGGSSLILYPDMDKPLEAIYGPHTRVVTPAEMEAIKV
jgi:hypothetical protein